jgi:outer membrane cobalamin receptor
MPMIKPVKCRTPISAPRMQWRADLPKLRSSLSIFLFALVIGMAAFDARAADSVDAADATSPPNNLDQILVTGQAIAVPLTAPASESVINENTIRDLLPTPSTTVETLLNSQPSIVATSGGPNGVRTKIFFRAFD